MVASSGYAFSLEWSHTISRVVEGRRARRERCARATGLRMHQSMSMRSSEPRRTRAVTTALQRQVRGGAPSLPGSIPQERKRGSATLRNLGQQVLSNCHQYLAGIYRYAPPYIPHTLHVGAPPGSMIGRNLTELNNDASPALGCPGVAAPHSSPLESVQGGRRALCCALSGRPTIHPFSSLQFCMCHVRWDFTCRDAVCHMTPHTARVPSVACLHVPTMQIVRELRWKEIDRNAPTRGAPTDQRPRSKPGKHKRPRPRVRLFRSQFRPHQQCTNSRTSLRPIQDYWKVSGRATGF